MRSLPSVILSFCLTITGSLTAQTFSIKPYFGYFIPRMGSVNDQIETQIERWSEIIGESIPSPGKISGNQVYGIQIEYPLNNSYFLNVYVSYYQEKVATEHFIYILDTPDRFYFERKLKLYDIFLNLHYYFDYSEVHRLNYYLGFGGGVSVSKARSVTVFTNTVNLETGAPIDTKGDFSGSTLSLVGTAGFDFRLIHFASLWGEVGLQYTKFGQLEGKVTRVDNPQPAETTSDSTFDFSGIFLRGGIAIALPFLKR